MNDKYYETVKYIGSNKGNIKSFELKRIFSLTRKNIRYDIEILTALNAKSVFIKASGKVKEEILFELLCSLLRFECIYDGCFFAPEKILFDEDRSENKDIDLMLSFYRGRSEYCQIQQPLDDDIYIRGFGEWEKFSSKYYYLLQMFFYASFTDGITSDLRMALFSEIFEPLSKMLEADGKIVVNNSTPFVNRKVHCPRCNNDFQDSRLRDPSLKDRIMAIINCYDETIFEGENTKTLVQMVVNTRNKILHLDNEKKNFLTGEQCGFYIKKFVMLLRLIIIKECGIYDYGTWQKAVERINYFNEEFPQCRILDE